VLPCPVEEVVVTDAKKPEGEEPEEREEKSRVLPLAKRT